jgi:hypothetical protein
MRFSGWLRAKAPRNDEIPATLDCTQCRPKRLNATRFVWPDRAAPFRGTNIALARTLITPIISLFFCPLVFLRALAFPVRKCASLEHFYNNTTGY